MDNLPHNLLRGLCSDKVLGIVAQFQSEYVDWLCICPRYGPHGTEVTRWVWERRLSTSSTPCFHVPAPKAVRRTCPSIR